MFDPPPSAALSRLGEGDVDADAVNAHRWLRADPAWIRPDINGARLYGVGSMLPIDTDDVAAFLPDLQTLLDDAGCRLEAVTPHRWYLRMPPDAVVPRFSTLAQALGADPFDHPPEGEGSRGWRTLDSEVQIALHQHPRNTERRRTGRPPVNALWWWGDAVLPDAAADAVPTIHSDDPLFRGIARRANVHCGPLPACWPVDADGFYDLRGQRGDALIEGWLLPALGAVERGMHMQWIGEEGEGFALSPRQRWRFWRKPLIPASSPDTWLAGA